MTICSSVVEVVFLRFGSLTRWIFKGGKMKLVYHLAAYVGFPSPSISFIWLYSAGRKHYMNSYYSCSSQQSLTVFAAHMHPQELGLAQSDAHCSTTEPWSHPNVTGQYWSLFKNFLNFRFSVFKVRMLNKISCSVYYLFIIWGRVLHIQDGLEFTMAEDDLELLIPLPSPLKSCYYMHEPLFSVYMVLRLKPSVFCTQGRSSTN